MDHAAFTRLRLSLPFATVSVPWAEELTESDGRERPRSQPSPKKIWSFLDNPKSTISPKQRKWVLRWLKNHQKPSIEPVETWNGTLCENMASTLHCFPHRFPHRATSLAVGFSAKKPTSRPPESPWVAGIPRPLTSLDWFKLRDVFSPEKPFFF